MDPNRLPEQHDPAKGCANCGNLNVVPGYPTPLCDECRQLFIKYPLPLWVKMFAAGILLVMLFSWYTFPKNFSLGIHLENGKKAEKAGKYLTAQREYEAVLQKVPGNTEAEARLMKVSFYNEDFEIFTGMAEKLAGRSFEDDELLESLNDLVDRFTGYYPDDSLQQIILSNKLHAAPMEDTVLLNYLSLNRDIYGMYYYAGVCFDKENYTTCDSVLNLILQDDENYIPALRLLATSQREQGQPELSIQTCNHMLAINRENAYAIASLARNYLKQKKDKEALQLALQSVETNKNEPYAIATLVLAYHFNNEQAKRDELIRLAKVSGDSTLMGFMEYPQDIIAGKQTFRN